MHALVERLYPLCRSITGDGVRATLEIVGEYVPLRVHEVPTGTQVLDWTVPQEWNIRDAYIADTAGQPGRRLRRVQPARARLQRAGVGDHAAGRAARPPAHPAGPARPGCRTAPATTAGTGGSAWPRRPWTRCRTATTRCVIDSTLADGHLTYAEHVVPGQVSDEVIVSCHVCHPSLANDNLAGIAVADVPGPGAGGADAVLHLPVPVRARHHRGDHLAGPQRGAGRPGQARAGAGLRRRPGPADVQAEQARRRGDRPGDAARAGAPPNARTSIAEFTPYGYDERQFCSPGFDLGVGSLTRTPYAGYPEYHTSADNPDFVSPEAMADTLRRLPRGVRRPRPQPAVRQPQPLRRTAAGPARAVRRRSAAAATPSRPRWPCSGC